MAKRTATKPATRKAQAKKANAPMKNAPKDKLPLAKAKADAKKAARTMAKTVTPGIRKSAAKRVEQDEKRAARMPLARQQQEGFAEVKKQANRLIAMIRNDVAQVADGGGNEEQCRQLVLAVSRAVISTKKKQGIVLE